MTEHLNVDGYYQNNKTSTQGNDQESINNKPDLYSRVSLNQMTTRRWSLVDDIKAVRKLGLNHLGLWRLKYEDYGEAKTAELLSQYQMNASSISWIGGFTGAHGYVIDDSMREAIQVIRYASWVGAQTVVVSTGEQGRHILSHANRLVIDSLRLLGDYACECNVQLAVLPMSSATAHGWTFLTSLQKSAELLHRCNHDHVGLCLHSYHALQDSKWKQILQPLLSQVKLVKLCDGVSPKRPRKQCLPGQGKMDLKSLVHLLESNRYQGLYEIDTWCEKHWKTNRTDQLESSLHWLATSVFQPCFQS